MSVPIGMVIHRLNRNFLEQEHLLGLLTRVVDGHQLTNRLGEALILLPEQTLTEIREAVGVPAEDPDTT